MDSLRDRQTSVLLAVLNLHGSAEEAGQSDYQSQNYLKSGKNDAEDSETQIIWKVLVLDDFCRDIISTLLKVSDLRENGITVHMMLNSPRSRIPDVPAIYLVQPTSENVQKICEDMVNDLYDLYYLNWASSISRILMEELAVSTVASKTSHQISQIYDKYIDFICPEENMFSLGIKDAYIKTHDPKIPDDVNQAFIDRILSSLFSILCTLKVIPLIFSAKGGAAEIIANRLNIKIRDHVLHNKNSLLSDPNGDGWAGPSSEELHNRPSLILLDRDFDIGAMLNHSWTYEPLVHDIDENGTTKKKTYDLDIKDELWSKIAFLPFPEAAGIFLFLLFLFINLTFFFFNSKKVLIDEISTSFKKEADEMTKIGGVGTLDDMQDLDFGASTKQLQRAISMLPELTARKATIDMHMNVATAILEKIKNRQLDVLFQIEEDISKQNKQVILEMIKSSERGSPQDKMRVLILYLLAKQNKNLLGSSYSSLQTSQASPGLGSGLNNSSNLRTNQSNFPEGMDEFEKALEESGCDLAPLNYFKKLQSLTKLSTSAPASSPNTGSTDFLGKFTSIGSKLTGIKDSAGLSGLFAGVRSFLPVNKDMAVVQVVNSIFDSASSALFSGANKANEYSQRNAPESRFMNSKNVLNVNGLENGVIFLDPLQSKQNNLNAPGRSPNSNNSNRFQNSIVFIVGGANYLEYQNLLNYANKSTNPRNIIYGSTDIVNPESFLWQLGQLDKED
ncbi:Protein sly1 [Smittium mucronatum]|uniref:Protein sly1 n=1 Tax=Smittium mucronatum TaxID=133383 RepID=A0A1R0GTA2_9FUNG|nr:Protein sly1 [Smittium mucronatum]